MTGPQPSETCKRGHSLSDPANVYVTKNYKRQCKTCNRLRTRARRGQTLDLDINLDGRRPNAWYVVPDGMKRCGSCEEVKSISEFHKDRSAKSGLQTRCKPCGIAAAQRFIESQGGNRAWNLKMKYGITEAEYDDLFNRQDGKCAICGERNYRNGVLDVDHNHATGVVRGLLCQNCNKAIGLLGENLDTLLAALRYLKEE